MSKEITPEEEALGVGTKASLTSPEGYSRYVLPFAYLLEAIPEAGPAPEWHWTPAQPEPGGILEELGARKRYLTQETAEVLFHRAEWYELKPAAGKSTPPFKDSLRQVGMGENAPSTVRIHRPALVLFERSRCLRGTGTPSPNAPACLLQTGFLILHVSWGAPEGSTAPPDGAAAPVPLDHLLALNDHLRHVAPPHPYHPQGMRRWVGGFDDTWTGTPSAPEQTSQPVKADPAVGEAAPHSLPEPLRIYLQRWVGLLGIPLRPTPNSQGLRLVPPDWFEKAQSWLKDSATHRGHRGWVVHADERAFTWTCVRLSQQDFARLRWCPASPTVDPGGDGEPKAGSVCRVWHDLLNVDSGNSPLLAADGLDSFKTEWTRNHSYYRWLTAGGGTLYGYSPHSGAMLTDGAFAPSLAHFRQMYFDQTLLLLYLRTTLFRFSGALTTFSAEAARTLDPCKEHDLGIWNSLEKSFATVRYQFSIFANLYQFPLLSNQQQAVEMYVLARKALDADPLYGEVKEQIEGTDEFLKINAQQRAAEEQMRMARRTDQLTIVATIGLATGLVVSLFEPLGANPSQGDAMNPLRWVLPLLIGCGIVFLAISHHRRIGRRFDDWGDAPARDRSPPVPTPPP